MLQVLLIICLFHKVSLSQLSGHGHETAVYGGDAAYRCMLADSTGVLQVTWQRLFHDNSVENLATYSNRFGQKVNEPFRGKLLFTEASLNSTSITLRNITWEDESCYICAFNVYPSGSVRKQMCLTVKGLSNISMSHVISSEERDHKVALFRCSATGRPAPTISWEYSTGAAVMQTEATETHRNGDNTFSSSRSVSLRVPAGWTGRVDCVLNNGTDTADRRSVHLSSHHEHGKGVSPVWVAIVIIISVLFVSSIIGMTVWKRSKRNSNNPEVKFSKPPPQPEYCI